jgi:hypothetical protein
VQVSSEKRLAKRTIAAYNALGDRQRREVTVIERRGYGVMGAEVEVGDGSLYDWFVEEILAADDPEARVEELETAMRLLQSVRRTRRFAGVAEAAFDEAAREVRRLRQRRRRRP